MQSDTGIIARFPRENAQVLQLVWTESMFVPKNMCNAQSYTDGKINVQQSREYSDVQHIRLKKQVCLAVDALTSSYAGILYTLTGVLISSKVP